MLILIQLSSCSSSLAATSDPNFEWCLQFQYIYNSLKEYCLKKRAGVDGIGGFCFTAIHGCMLHM
jgi:hypothetical protein